MIRFREDASKFGGAVKLVVITPFPPMKIAEADHGLLLCQYLAEANNDVHVLTTVGSISISSPRLSVSPLMRDWSWRELPRLTRFFKKVAPDAVLLFYFGMPYGYHPMITFIPTLLKKLLPKLRFVTQFPVPAGAENWRAPLTTRLVRKIAEKWAGVEVDYTHGTLLRDSDRIIVFSDAHRQTLAEHFHAANQKSVLIPPPPLLRMAPEKNGVYRRRVNDQFQIDERSFLIEYFGYIYRGKGIETLLNAFRMVVERKPQLHLLIVGEVAEWETIRRPDLPLYSDVLRNQVKELGLEDRVGWTGGYPWDSDAGSCYLRAADICVLPFDRGVYFNNSSFSAAAAHGLPIISTRAEVVEPAFVHEENVLLCPPKDPASMATAIERMVDDAALRQRLREGVRRMAHEWFSWEKVIERTLAVIRTDSSME
jgi:glycosyltransferase involved in cell wall biosynthesis